MSTRFPINRSNYMDFHERKSKVTGGLRDHIC